MNLKKTIAALSAAAVAVSAMATTVSAEEEAKQGSFTYDLVRETKTIEDGTATVTYVASGLELNQLAGSNLVMTLRNGKGDSPAWKLEDGYKTDEAVYTITVTKNGTSQIWTKEISSKNDKANFSTWISKVAGSDDAIITIPCVDGATTAGIDVHKGATAADSAFDSNVRIQIVAQTKHTIKDDSQKKFNDAIADGNVYALFNVVSSADLATIAANDAEIAKITADETTVNAWAAGVDAADAAAIAALTSVAGKALTPAAGATVTAAELTAYKTALATAKTTLANANTTLAANTTTKVAPQIASTNAGEKVHLYPMMTTVNGIARPNGTGSNTTILRDGKQVQNDQYDLITATQSKNYQEFDLIDYLELNRGDLNDVIGKVGYHNVLPVLNDVIANYDDVTFTFKTSALYVNIDTRDQNTASYVKKDDDKEFGEGFTEKKDDYWYNPSFGQHLYGKDYYDAEGSGFIGTQQSWAFNLFTGGLTVNNKYTMSLNDTQVFDWGESTLSFDWDSVSDGKVTNARYLLEYMNLYTSTPWFWDSMTVTFSNAVEIEDAESGEGVEGEEDIVDEETEATEETEAPAEDEAPVEDEAPAANPATGNASVALAVIPVALAAAAIVAKKRG